MTQFTENIITLLNSQQINIVLKLLSRVNNMTLIGDVELRSIVKFCVALEKSIT